MPLPIAQKHFDEAELFRENGLYKEAIEAYKKAAEADPNFISAYYNLALIYYQNQCFDSAIVNLKKVIELDPSDASAFNNLGVMYSTINIFGEANKYFEKSLSIEPDYKEARDNLEKVHQKLQMLEAQSFLKQPAEASYTKRCLKIGFVSIWFERGQSYVTKTLRDVIARNHETFVFARTGGVYGQPKLDTNGYWNVPNLTTYPNYQIPPDVLIKWIQGNNLDMIIFNEEYDWNMVMAAKSTGTKILTYLDYYKEDWKPYMSLYDAVLCSTKRTFNLVNDICKAHYIGWGVDTELFKPNDNGNGKYTFFHNAGWLGINYRKMTPAVILAFDALSHHLADATLFVHAQTELEKLPAEVVNIVKNSPRITYHVETVPAPGLYHKGRILVFPSKLEGLGLPLLEGMACGLPAIATDAPPMNEFVRNGYNGLLVKVANTLTREDNIAFPETIVDIQDLAVKMAEIARDTDKIKHLSIQTRRYTEKDLNLNVLAMHIDRVLTGPLMQKPVKHSRSVSKETGRISDNSYTTPTDNGSNFCNYTVHLVGAQETNFPWGIENRLIPVLEEVGCKVISTDFRKNRNKLPQLLQQPADLMLVCKGEWIPPELIRTAPCPTVLWYAEQVGTVGESDLTAEARRRELSYNIDAFDYVFSHDQGNLGVYKILGAKSVGWLPTAAVDPNVHRPLGLEKIYNVTFVGTITPRRKAVLDVVSQRIPVHVTNIWDPVEVNRLFNQSKIVLNIHLSDLPNTETRIAEVLGAGAFLLTEEVSSPEFLQDGKHMTAFKICTVDDLISKIIYYLEHNEEREAIAACGHEYVMTHHTFKGRMKHLLSTVCLKNSENRSSVMEVACGE